MRNESYGVVGAAVGVCSGSVAWALLRMTAGYTAGTLASASGGVLLLSTLPFVVGLVPFYRIAKQINHKYEDNPCKLMSSYFLLTASSITLAAMLHIAIVGAFVSTINPFTLPILIATGVSACVMLGLYLCSRETRPAPLGQEQQSLSNYFCSLFSRKSDVETRNDTSDIDTYLATQYRGS